MISKKSATFEKVLILGLLHLVCILLLVMGVQSVLARGYKPVSSLLVVMQAGLCQAVASTSDPSDSTSTSPNVRGFRRATTL